MLALLYNTPDDAEVRSQWSFAHQDAHSKIVEAIFQQTGTPLALYILDPMPDPKSAQFQTWTEIHQQAHTAFDAILGIQGNNLTALDVSQPDQIEVWIRLHADEHIQAQKALNYPD